jgi:anti-sigma factor ChrR (cupin superfamily)
MMDERLNSNFTQRVVIRTHQLPWITSPQAGVERRPLDRIGGEVARATSLVRYAPASSFSAHTHALGEEFLVLDGVFSDEHGDYPRGTYVRNPPGSCHTPRTAKGCVIMVKLRQMPMTERRRVVVDTRPSPWPAGDRPGHTRLELHSGTDGSRERVTMERLEPGAYPADAECPGGEEIFVLTGTLTDEHGPYEAGTWIRNPPGYRRHLKSERGAVYWRKEGHLISEIASPR